MGIISLLILSNKKTKTMNKIARLMLNPPHITSIDSLLKGQKHYDEIKKKFDDLFAIMSSMPGFSEILKTHNATSEDLEKISSRVQLAGYSFASNGDYIPVAVVSFGDALNHVLIHKEKILNYSNNEVIEVIEETIKLL